MNTRVMSWTLLLLAAGPLAAADGLDVSTGLWEVTYTTATNGMMVPQSVLESMTPAQRERITAAMQKRAAAGPRTRTVKSCVTANDLKQGAFRGEDDASCKHTVVAQTRNKQEATIQCSGAESRSGHMKVEATDRNHITGAVDMSSGNGKVSMQLAGRWLKSSCAGADE